MYELTMSSPGKNSLGTPLMERMLAELEAARDQPILLSGANDVFCAGLDLKEVAAADGPAMERYLGLLDRLVERLYLHPAPVVALVNGHAIAGGCILALCADVRIAAADPKIRIGLNEVAIGVRFPPRILALVSARVPRHTIDRALLEGGLYDPVRAREIGFIDEVAGEGRGGSPNEGLIDAPTVARAQLARLAALPRPAYQATKRDLRGHVLSVAPELTQRWWAEALPLWLAPELKASLIARLK